MTPRQIRQGQVETRPPSEAAWDAAEERRTLDAHVVAAGVTQNRLTQDYHTWVSLYGTDLTSWYVGPDGALAQAYLLAIKKLFGEWGGTEDDRESMDALLALAIEQSSSPYAVLPDDQVRHVLAEVAQYVSRKN